MSCRKLVLNLVIFVLCGAIAVSVPFMIKFWQKRTVTANEGTNTTTSNCTLASKFVGDQLHLSDYYFVWQVYLIRDFQVVVTWEEIYADISPHNPLVYDTENFILTPYGLCYRGLSNDHVSRVTYQGHSCLLVLN